MAKIKKLTLDGATIYPATIMEAVKNHATNKTLAAELLTLAKAVNSGATTPDEALSALTALGSGYDSLVAVATTLKDFLTNATDSDTVINKWKEVETFLNGIDEGSNILSKFVTTDTQQTITGRKDFSDGIIASGSSAFDNIQINGNIDIQNDAYITFEEGFHISSAFGNIEPPAGSGVLALKSDIPSIPGTATQSADGLMSAADKKKLDDINTAQYVTLTDVQTITGRKDFSDGIIASGSSAFDNIQINGNIDIQNDAYITFEEGFHISTAFGDIEPPAGSGVLALKSDIPSIPGTATQSADGLMSAADKKKLDSFEVVACNDVTDYPEITI